MVCMLSVPLNTLLVTLDTTFPANHQLDWCKKKQLKDVSDTYKRLLTYTKMNPMKLKPVYSAYGTVRGLCYFLSSTDTRQRCHFNAAFAQYMSDPWNVIYTADAFVVACMHDGRSHGNRK